MSETRDIVAPTLEALRRMGVMAWRVNAGGRTRRSVQAPPGTPDILGVLSPSGRLFGLEAKTAKGKLSEAQEKWHKRARECGVLVGVVHSVMEAMELMEDWRDGTVAMARLGAMGCSSLSVSDLVAHTDAYWKRAYRMYHPSMVAKYAPYLLEKKAE